MDRLHAAATQGTLVIQSLQLGTGFVVTWSEFTRAGSGDGSGYGIAARRFDASGTAIDASEVIINEETSGSQQQSVVSELSNGNHVVVWTSVTSAPAGALAKLRAISRLRFGRLPVFKFR